MFPSSPRTPSASLRLTGASKLLRIGVPVTSRVDLGKYRLHSANPIRTLLDSFAFKRFALPGIAFDSWINAGRPAKRPARIGAVEVNPPIPRTARGPKDR